MWQLRSEREQGRAFYDEPICLGRAFEVVQQTLVNVARQEQVKVIAALVRQVQKVGVSSSRRLDRPPCECLEIWADEIRNALEFCGSPEGVHISLARAHVVAKCLERDIESDLRAVLVKQSATVRARAVMTTGTFSMTCRSTSSRRARSEKRTMRSGGQ